MDITAMEVFSKSPTYLKEYKNDNRFNLFEAKRDCVIFRAQVSSLFIPGKTNLRSTVDLIFVGTLYIEIPFELKGLKLTKPKDHVSKRYSDEYDEKKMSDSGERVYSIESNNKRYNIVTSDLWILVHKDRTDVSPLEHLYYGDIEKYNLYLDDYVKDWIKIN